MVFSVLFAQNFGPKINKPRKYVTKMPLVPPGNVLMTLCRLLREIAMYIFWKDTQDSKRALLSSFGTSSSGATVCLSVNIEPLGCNVEIEVFASLLFTYNYTVV